MSSPRTPRLIAGRALLLLLMITPALSLRGQYGTRSGEWPVYGGDGGSTRYSALDQIHRDNVKSLNLAWRWRSDNFGNVEFKNETTPIMINGVLYFTAGSRRSVIAADAGTGETLWTWRINEGQRYDKAPRRSSGRGVAYWTDGRDQRIVTVTPGFQLVALDAKTGDPVPTFGRNGIVDLFKELGGTEDPIGTIGNTSPPVIARDVIVVGPALIEGGRPKSFKNTKADVMAFDARTGKKLWTFHTIPRPGEFGYDTWLNGSAAYTGNAGVWPPFSVDTELGYVYLPVEDATSDYYGGHRPGNNLFSASLVCLDIKTGRRVWHQQQVHHDIWDYDNPAPPILIDINANGKKTKAVVQLTKQAFAYVYDRLTGDPVWPIEERPVAKSDVPGEWTAATQPFPTKPPAFDRQGISKDDLIDFTPELRQRALQAIEGYRIGPLYTPPSLANAPDGTKGTLVLPGSLGGANWEAGAADPETGFVYVASQNRPSLHALAKPADSDMDLAASGNPLPTVDGLSVLKPPYGRITAYDMNQGVIVWQMANGNTPPSVRDHPLLRGVDLPRTGSRSRAGLLLTKTLLFAGDGWGGLPHFRAHDKLTGEILWETEIPAGTLSGLPMTYMHQGKQYIVFTAGDAGTEAPAQILAYTLPSPERKAP